MSEYFDIKNKQHLIIERISANVEREQTEQDVVEELYRIFAGQ